MYILELELVEHGKQAKADLLRDTKLYIYRELVLHWMKRLLKTAVGLLKLA